MGEAKRRGTYEQRHALAIKQRKVDDKAAAIRRANEPRRRLSQHEIALMVFLTAHGYNYIER